MHRLLINLAMTIGLCLQIAGCAANHSIARTEQELIDQEKAEQDQQEWRRGGWITDQADELTPYRIHGGVGPASSSI